MSTREPSDDNGDNNSAEEWAREQRMEELKLLAGLYKSDDPVSKLRKLWSSQKGTKMKIILTDAAMKIGNPDKWNESEHDLCSLIRVHPDFLEAKMCLSKLYCLQGKFQEAKQLALDVLEERPWHFGALETMRVVSLATNDEINYAIWDARRIPSLRKTEETNEERKRQQWVDRAMADAERLLGQSEQQQEVRQQHEDNKNDDNNQQKNDHDEWQ